MAGFEAQAEQQLYDAARLGIDAPSRSAGCASSCCAVRAREWLNFSPLKPLGRAGAANELANSATGAIVLGRKLHVAQLGDFCLGVAARRRPACLYSRL